MQALPPDGDGGIAFFEELREDPAKGSDRALVDRLLGEALSFPRDARAEAYLFVGEARLGRLHDPKGAREPLRRAAADPAAPPMPRRLAATLLVRDDLALGLLDDAERDLTPETDPSATTAVRRALARRRAERIAWPFSLAVTALLGIEAAAARRGRPVAARGHGLKSFAIAGGLFALWVAGVGGGLVAAYDGASPAPFIVLGLGIGAFVLLVRAAAHAGGSPLRRGARALVAAGGALTIAFLALDSTVPDPWSTFLP